MIPEQIVHLLYSNSKDKTTNSSPSHTFVKSFAQLLPNNLTLWQKQGDKLQLVDDRLKKMLLETYFFRQLVPIKYLASSPKLSANPLKPAGQGPNCHVTRVSSATPSAATISDSEVGQGCGEEGRLLSTLLLSARWQGLQRCRKW